MSRHSSAAEEIAPSPAEDLVQRTAKAVQFGCRNMATDLATFIDSLPMPENESDQADKIADATEVYVRALSWFASYTYGLCLLLRKDVSEAGHYFRRDDVQQEMRDRAMRAAMEVMGK